MEEEVPLMHGSNHTYIMFLNLNLNHKQTVIINGHESEEKILKHGVPPRKCTRSTIVSALY